MRIHTVLRAMPLVLAAALGAACADRLPSGAAPESPPPEVRRERAPLRIALLCQANVASGTARCGPVPPAGRDARLAIIYGGQGQYVQLTSTAPSYDPGTEIYQFGVTVQNLLAQPIGTTDGTTLHADGVRVFFSSLAVTSGTGTVSVANADGTGTFTASGQPYFQYDEVLDPSETSAAKSWRFNVPATVQSFSFVANVSTEVPFPSGWVEVSPGTVALELGLARQLSATSRTALGSTVTGETLTWTSADTLVARVNASGIVRAVGAGTTTVSASAAISGGGTRPNRVAAQVTVTRDSLLVSFEAGRNHTCALTDEGQAWCWGRNVMAQLGDSTAAPTLVPVAVVQPAGVAFTQVSGGGEHTCAVTGAGQAYCWGANGDRRLGNNTFLNPMAPIAVTQPPGVTFTRVSAGGEHTCALTSGGQAYCWGYNGSGQIGNGATAYAVTPTAVSQPAGVTFTQIAAGQQHTCALASTGQAYCWGGNPEGQVGDNSTTTRRTPVAVQQGALTFVSVSAVFNHSCGLTSGGQAYCWGRGDYGQIGDNATTDRLVPTAVTQPPGVTFASLQAGGDQSCAVTSAGQAYCWGRNQYGQLGDGSTLASPVPVAVSQGVGVVFASVSPDQQHACALRDNGKVFCWGRNATGFAQVGDGTMTQRSAPVPISF